MTKVAIILFSFSSLLLLTHCGGGKSVHNRPGRGTYCKTTDAKVLVNNETANEKLLKFKPGKTKEEEAENKELVLLAGNYEYSGMTFEYRMPIESKKKLFIYHKTHKDDPYKNKSEKIDTTQLQALEDGHIDVSPTQASCIYGYTSQLQVPEVNVAFVKNLTLTVDDVKKPTKWNYKVSKLFEAKVEENLSTPKVRGVTFIDNNEIENEFSSWNDLIAKVIEDPKELKGEAKFYEISEGLYNLNYQLQLESGPTVTVNIEYKKK